MCRASELREDLWRIWDSTRMMEKHVENEKETGYIKGVEG